MLLYALLLACEEEGLKEETVEQPSPSSEPEASEPAEEHEGHDH